jgi:formylmethanofuran dehydrogenase subunit C
MQTAVRTESKNPALIAASGKFKGFGPESEKLVRAPIAKPDWMLDGLLDAFTKFRKANASGEYQLDEAVKLFSHLPCSAGDVERLTIALIAHTECDDFAEKAGVFLSALINNSMGQRYVLHLRDLPELGCIGMENTKHIVIDGNAGFYCGKSMKKGSITVMGDAGPSPGVYMEGGILTIEGNAGHSLGLDMKNGKIIVNGDADDHCGNGAQGGEILVRRNTSDLCGANMRGGSVIVEGNTRASCGGYMLWGKIEVMGDCGMDCGNKMTGGTIVVHGEIGSVATFGRIIHKGELIVDK